MSDASYIYIVEPCDQKRALLERSLSDYGFENIQIIADIIEAGKESHVITFCAAKSENDLISYIKKPYRFSKLARLIEKLSDHNAMKGDVIDMFGYILNAAYGDITLPYSNAVIRLTEKERDVLLCLFDSSPQEVSKQDLLDKVWGYGAAIETHTLETHIYRLRQKLEQDASNPRFLVTGENGYTLSS